MKPELQLHNLFFCGNKIIITKYLILINFIKAE
jgi:hypothetical protein